MKTTPTHSFLLALALAAVALPSFAAKTAEILSSWDIVSCTGCLDGQSNFDGGTGAGANVFNGTFGDYQMQPRASNGATYIIDLSAKENAPAGGYYVTEIKVDSTGDKAYTLQYTTDGSNWTTVDGANSVKAAGIASYSVGALATKVRYVFNNGAPWDFSTQFLAEIQVLGMDPADIDCTHPSWTQWTAVPDSATCTTKGVEERFCTTCNERQTKLSDTVAPLGHDYRSHLEQAGTVTAYGSGYVDCSRCDFKIEFSEPVDLTTYGGLAMENLVQFTDITVSSTFHQEWGPNPVKLFDGYWEWDDNVGFWLSSEYEAMSVSHVDYHFGAPVDLTSVEISVHNHNQTLQFYDVDDTTGEERLLAEQVVHENTEEGAPGYQRMKVYAFAGACTHLRLRTANDDGYSLWGYRPCMLVIEMRPYGTIAGANKLDPGAPMFLLMQ